ncbi:TATA element modulatory factor [Bradysia coprophila]|uniref:TATA element modulatory factor n=1 Tax=Bradysia coprophila TaxID=38358 RepID=UPI00187DC812|nr:TATA element modulatory factor [Bradysia coprophila]
MSWFDTTGIASLAKNALKEAQKTIDKALDIKDDESAAESATFDSSILDSQAKSANMKHSSSNSALQSSIWGSFTGSFFDNPIGDTKTVTTPPSSSVVARINEDLCDILERPAKETSQNESEGNSSASVEIMSPPTTPGSNLTSPEQLSGPTVQHSESVEVISATTPSSDLITVSSSSPSEQLSLSCNLNPDSVEVISDEFMDEDLSIEDDSKSYNTVTESTTIVTVFEGSSKAITTAPSRSGLHLSLEASTADLIKSSDRKSLNEMKVSVDSDTKKVPRLIEDAMLEKSIESFDSQTQFSDSTHSFEEVQPQNQDSGNRSDSPQSSEEHSDIVKVSSEQNSSDEIETATSSDIEIISPNGDSSSTNSVHKVSPLNCSIQHAELSKKKGHSRELSTHSMQSNASDDSRFSYQPETERLMRRISELSDILESREYKLMELGRENAELREKNAEMKVHLDTKRKRDDCMEVTSVTEEYTQRLSAIEKKFQQSIRERDNLRDQLKAARSDLASKMSKEDIQKVINEKDFMIEELKTEGEKLSKQILQNSNIIKKLRAKEKDSDSTLKRQNEQIEELTDEMERLKKSLSAKDEVERSQIEAVHKLSSEKRKLERENGQLKSQLDDTTQKLKTLQTSFEAAKKELNERQQSHSELTKKAEVLAILESEKNATAVRNEQILIELSSLREKLKQVEGGNNQKELNLRRENAELLRRLEETELKLEQQTGLLSDSTIPLFRQIEALQSTLDQRNTVFEGKEKHYLEQIDELQCKFTKLSNTEQVSTEQRVTLKNKISTLEEEVSTLRIKLDKVSDSIQQKEMEFVFKENELRDEIKKLHLVNEERTKELDESRSKIEKLHGQLNVEKEIGLSERRRGQELERKVKRLSESNLEPDDKVDSHRGDVSPTLSLGHASNADSLSSALWPMEDIDCVSNSGRQNSIYGASGFGSATHTTLLENLQASLKQRDGENHQLQWELSRLQADRNFLMTEVSNLTSQLETIKEKFNQNEHVAIEYNELQRKYDAILQMYGEKVEETEELQLDLLDVKEMYKAQIDELLKQQKERDKAAND